MGEVFLRRQGPKLPLRGIQDIEGSRVYLWEHFSLLVSLGAWGAEQWGRDGGWRCPLRRWRCPLRPSPAHRMSHPVTVTQTGAGAAPSPRCCPTTTSAWLSFHAVLFLALGHRRLLPGPEGQSLGGVERGLDIKEKMHLGAWFSAKKTRQQCWIS